MNDSHDVVVVGAGPAGLVAAAQLARHGVDVLVLDKRTDVSPLSRAVGVTVRQMEIFRGSRGWRRISGPGPTRSTWPSCRPAPPPRRRRAPVWCPRSMCPTRVQSQRGQSDRLGASAAGPPRAGARTTTSTRPDRPPRPAGARRSSASARTRTAWRSRPGTRPASAATRSDSSVAAFVSLGSGRAPQPDPQAIGYRVRRGPGEADARDQRRVPCSTVARPRFTPLRALLDPATRTAPACSSPPGGGTRWQYGVVLEPDDDVPALRAPRGPRGPS